jgi:hypothetical protein
MQAQQEDDAEDDGGEENLSDVVIEDLLVGVFLSECFAAGDGIDCSEFVLIYAHVLDSLGWEHRDFPAFGPTLFMGSSRVSKGKVFITKVPPSLQLLSAKICGLI